MKTTEEINLNNHMIKEFMGDDFMQNVILPMRGFSYPKLEDMRFHNLWEWLMPVVKKCKNISLQSEELAFDNGKPTTNLHIQTLYEEIEHGLLELDIDLTLEAAVNFIDYFNKTI